MPVLQRTGLGLGPGQRADAGRPRRRRVGRERPEGLDVGRYDGGPRDAARPSRHGRAQAQGPRLLHHRGRSARHRGAAAQADDGPRHLQRGLLHRRPCGARRPHRPPRGRVGGGRDHARLRARGTGRRRRGGAGLRPHRGPAPRGARREGRRRRGGGPNPAGTGRPAPGRARDVAGRTGHAVRPGPGSGRAPGRHAPHDPDQDRRAQPATDAGRGRPGEVARPGELHHQALPFQRDAAHPRSRAPTARRRRDAGGGGRATPGRRRPGDPPGALHVDRRRHRRGAAQHHGRARAGPPREPDVDRDLPFRELKVGTQRSRTQPKEQA